MHAPPALNEVEGRLYRHLTDCEGFLVTQEALSYELYGTRYRFSDTMRMHIHRLRKKLAGSYNIEAVRGEGYVLTAV